MVQSEAAVILVIDDSSSMREILRAILRRAGYGVLLAANSWEAISTFLTHPSGIDLVVSDVRLPGVAGAALVAQLRLIDPRLRCILMSGDADPARYPGIPILSKPFSMYQLLKNVMDALKAE